MLQNLHSDDFNYQNDPSTSKQYNTEPPKDQQIQWFNKAVNSLKVDLLATLRDGLALSPVQRLSARGLAPIFSSLRTNIPKSLEIWT